MTDANPQLQYITRPAYLCVRDAGSSQAITDCRMVSLSWGELRECALRGCFGGSI